MKLLIQIVLPLLSISIFVYSVILTIRSRSRKVFHAIIFELAGLVLLNWSANKILKAGSVLGFAFALISLIILFFTIRYLIINSKINKK